MRMCWAVQREEAPGRDFSRSGLVVLPSGVRVPSWFRFGFCRPGLYEFIQYTYYLVCVLSPFLSFLRTYRFALVL